MSGAGMPARVEHRRRYYDPLGPDPDSIARLMVARLEAHDTDRRLAFETRYVADRIAEVDAMRFLFELEGVPISVR